MKLAWLCYNDEGEGEVEIKFDEPESWQYNKIVPIVYAKIEE